MYPDLNLVRPICAQMRLYPKIPEIQNSKSSVYDLHYIPLVSHEFNISYSEYKKGFNK